MADPTIKIKRSAVAGKIPTPDQVPLGEIALNTYDGYLYASKNVGIGTTVIAINPFRVGTGTDSYNAYFTAGNVGIGSTQPNATLTVSAPSGFTGNILDAQIGGSSRFSVQDQTFSYDPSSGAKTKFHYGSFAPNTGWVGINYRAHTGPVAYLTSLSNTAGVAGVNNTGYVAWLSTSHFTSYNDWDLRLYRDTSGVLAQRNDTNPNTFRVYNTYTSSTNFERANVGWTTDVFIVGTEKGSAGGTARQLELQTDGTTRVAITTAGNVGIGSTLPTSALTVQGDVSISGVVTASGGFNLGISSAGTSITSSPITTLNFIGAGNTFAVNGTTVDVSIAGGGGGGSQVSVSTVAPSTPTEGDLWYNSNLGRTFVYYDDGSSQQWVDVAPFNQGGTNSTVTVSSSAPSSPTEGQLWYNTILARTFIYYADGTSSQWVDAAPFNVTQTEDDTADGKTDSTITATEGQTVFNVAYQVGYVDVYLNGVRLSQTEFTATNGTQIVLSSGASAGDIFDAVEYKKYVIGITTEQYDNLTYTKTLTIGTRSTNPGVIPLVGSGMTISLRSGVGTANF